MMKYQPLIILVFLVVVGQETEAALESAKEAHAKAKEAHAKTKEARTKTKEGRTKTEEANPKSKETHSKSREARLKIKESHLKAEEPHVKSKELDPIVEDSAHKSKESHHKSKESHLKHKESQLKHKESQLKRKESNLKHKESNCDSRLSNSLQKIAGYKEKWKNLAYKIDTLQDRIKYLLGGWSHFDVTDLLRKELEVISYFASYLSMKLPTELKDKRIPHTKKMCPDKLELMTQKHIIYSKQLDDELTEELNFMTKERRRLKKKKIDAQINLNSATEAVKHAVPTKKMALEQKKASALKSLTRRTETFNIIEGMTDDLKSIKASLDQKKNDYESTCNDVDNAAEKFMKLVGECKVAVWTQEGITTHRSQMKEYKKLAETFSELTQHFADMLQFSIDLLAHNKWRNYLKWANKNES